MTRARTNRLTTLQVSASLELGTGVALLAAPSIVTKLLLGAAASGQEAVLARLLGGGLVSLGATGLMSGSPSASRGAVVGFTVYNGATAALLGLAEVLGTADGILLRPIALFHGGVALLLLPQALARAPMEAVSRPASASPR